MRHRVGDSYIGSFSVALDDLLNAGGLHSTATADERSRCCELYDDDGRVFGSVIVTVEDMIVRSEPGPSPPPRTPLTLDASAAAER